MCRKWWSILAAVACISAPAAAASQASGSGANERTSAMRFRPAAVSVNTAAALRIGGRSSSHDNELQIVAGQGQVLRANSRTEEQNDRGGEPLVVRLVDSNGNAVPNVPIEWTFVAGQGNVRPLSSRTDGEGFARAHATVNDTGGVPYLVNRVRARVEGSEQEAVFYLVAMESRPPTGTGSITVVRNSDPNIQGRAGQVIPNAIQYTVVATDTGMPVPFVGMHLEYADTPSNPLPTAQCEGGFALSNERGLINCNLVVGPIPGGPRTLEVVVGSRVRLDVSLEVVGGLPGRVRIVSGNDQTGGVGQELSPLRVRVTDNSGRVLPDTRVDWDIPQGITVVSRQDVTDQNGEASATIRLGNTPGPVQVIARAGSAGALFNLTATASTGVLSKISGDQQSAATGQQFSAPLVVRVVDSQGATVPNATVNFAITGPATLMSPTATTGSNGTASMRVTAGNAPGAVTVTASYGATSATFNLTVRAPGLVFTSSDVFNGAGYQAGISPGSIAYLLVQGVAPDLQGSVTPQNPADPLPTTLRGVQVIFNNISAPIFAVSNVAGQESVIVQVPFEVTPGAASVTVRGPSGDPVTAENVTIAPTAPGVFMFVDVSNRIYAVATRADGSYVTSANPARRGETLRVYATGLGQTTPATGTNRIAQSDQDVNAEVVARLNGQDLEVVRAELYAGTIGVYEITVQIPENAAAGMEQALQLAVRETGGSLVNANQTVIPVQ